VEQNRSKPAVHLADPIGVKLLGWTRNGLLGAEFSSKTVEQLAVTGKNRSGTTSRTEFRCFSSRGSFVDS
jgi:hypothetical protein